MSGDRFIGFKQYFRCFGFTAKDCKEEYDSHAKWHSDSGYFGIHVPVSSVSE